MRILFICKRNECYSFVSYCRRSSGLWNSTRFIVESLQAKGVNAKIVEVHDNNDIDREIHKFNRESKLIHDHSPLKVIIEALWVVPSKFLELKPLHPKVKWFVHLHSHIPFLAIEGIAMQWIDGYGELGVGIIANSLPAYDALKAVVRHKGLRFLPNVYLSNPRHPKKSRCVDHIDIGCFGAVRPLKNQLLQAMAAIRFANESGKRLRFHINGSRTETMGDPVLKNIKELFSMTPHARLVQHAWHEPEDFIRQIEMKIDIGMQVSLTETFNVVTADYVTAGVPVVTSKEVSWVNWFSKAKDDSIDSIVRHMRWAYRFRCLIKLNQWLLKRNSKKAQKMWYRFLKEI